MNNTVLKSRLVLLAADFLLPAFLIVSVFVFFGACRRPAIHESAAGRYAMVTGIRPEKIAYYKDLHAHAWPGVLKKIKECNIRNYSIYLKEIDSNYYLFSYFEYTGKDFEADMRKMAADSVTRRWWRETDPTQLPLPDAAAKNEIWSRMEEVFYVE